MKKNIESMLNKVKHWTYHGQGLRTFLRNYSDCMSHQETFKLAAEDKRYNIILSKDLSTACITESLLGKVFRLSKKYGSEYALNAFDIRREIPDFPANEEQLKKLAKELGKPFTIYDAAYENDIVPGLRKGRKTMNEADERLKELFPEKYWTKEISVTPEKITYRRMWTQITENKEILDWDIYIDGKQYYVRKNC